MKGENLVKLESEEERRPREEASNTGRERER